MVRLNKIYTRTGDSGTTGLVDGSRVAKADPRMAAIGDVDEANSLLGVAPEHVADGEAAAMLRRIQNELFDLGADLATPGDDFAPTGTALRVIGDQVARLEAEIDAVNAGLEPLCSFVLPAGSGGPAWLFLARAVVRRAERSAVGAGAAIPLNPQALAYLNRLSDHLFVLARKLASAEGGETLWQPGATRGD